MPNLPYRQVASGKSPLLVVTPHTGTAVPLELLSMPTWRSIEGRQADPFGVILGAAASSKGMSSLSASYHPCVIDCNVPLDSRFLSVQVNRFGLCRTHTSQGEALYVPGQQPSEEAVVKRADAYWRPFHATLEREVGRLRELYPNVLVLVSHASSWLSPYRDRPGAAECNLGTNRGLACDGRLVATLTKAVQAAGRSWVVNGKFADAFAAQNYGEPEHGVHVIEVEIAGRWRIECAQRRLDKVDQGFDETGARALLDSLESAVRMLSVTERPL